MLEAAALIEQRSRVAPDRAGRRPPIPFVFAILQRYVTPTDTVLDLGCGTAPYRGLLGSKLIGVDHRGGDQGDHFADADVVARGDVLPFATGSVDVVFAVAALYQMSRPD